MSAKAIRMFFPVIYEFDYFIDASEGRFTAGDYVLLLHFAGKDISVKISAIGIGFDPTAFVFGDTVAVLANSSVWVLKSGAPEFKEIDLDYPVMVGEAIDEGFLVYHHLGCSLVSTNEMKIAWNYMGGQLDDFSRDGRVITLEFDECPTPTLIDVRDGTEINKLDDEQNPEVRH